MYADPQIRFEDKVHLKLKIKDPHSVLYLISMKISRPNITFLLCPIFFVKNIKKDTLQKVCNNDTLKSDICHKCWDN